MQHTVVFQEFKSQSSEPCSLTLKLNSPKPDLLPRFLDFPGKSKVCGFSCIQSMSDRGLIKENPEAYVPPVPKIAASSLSLKSLEMCTENLGSETGSDDVELSIFSESESSTQTAREVVRKSRQKVETRRGGQRDFPPPLTTISGSNSILVKPRRENGRLVIEAFSAPAKRSCMQAERSDGRLRLSMVRDYDYTSDSDSEEQEIEGEETDECEYQLGEEEEEEEDCGDVYWRRKDTDGIKWNAGVRLEMEEFQTPSRCKEGGRAAAGRRLMNWEEPLWVVTS